jgi:MFS family permease
MLTAEKERGAYMGVIGLVWGLGAILGPVVGGVSPKALQHGVSFFFLKKISGNRIYLHINSFVAGICAPVYIIYFPSILPPNDGKSSLAKLFNIDWTGITPQRRSPEL